jgi:hypothetical protein
MKPSAPVKSGNEVKTPVVSNSGPLIRLPVKKMYCSKCQRLVKGQKKGSGKTTQIICPRCNQTLWYWESIAWKNGEKAAISQ